MDTIAPIKQSESEVYDEIEKDLRKGLMDGGVNDGTD